MKRFRNAAPPLLVLLALASPPGCKSPYYADKGAGVGAVGGAGVGALVGHAVGNTAAGALVGAGVGALGGAAVGCAIDDAQAKNRAEIAAQLGRQVPAGSATMEEVVAMTNSGIDPQLIQNYVRTSGMARPLTASDVIYLHNNGVATDVIQTMQEPPPAAPAPIVVQQPQPVVVERYYDPYWGPPGCYYHYGYGCRRPPGVAFGVSFR